MLNTKTLSNSESASDYTMKQSHVNLIQNNCKNDFDFYVKHYCQYQNEKGGIYTWGSGEMGQLGYANQIISLMPKDREGYPFQVI